MPDARFYITHDPFSIDAVAELSAPKNIIKGLNKSATIKSIATIDNIEAPETVIFLDNKQQINFLSKHKATLCFVSQKIVDVLENEVGPTLFVVDNPRAEFAVLADKLHTSRNERLLHSDDLPNAIISPSAEIHPTAIISKGVKILDNTSVGAYTYIGPSVEIGRDCYISSGVHISHTTMGDRCHAFANVVIGEAGFGFVPTLNGLKMIPQLGRVLIGNDVSIGTTSTLDRGAINDTIISDGCKIDNQVQIAHNVSIGKNTVIVSQTGISGSTKLGDNVMVGGQSGFAGHLKVGSNSIITARSGVMQNVEEGQRVAGFPAAPAREWFRQMVILSRLAKQKK